MKQISIIGSGFSALSAACYLAKAGHSVDLYEKNNTIGGRARQLKREGFTFDMGPSWYWMPDIFDKFFADFDKKTSDYYQLDKLSPAYKVYFNEGHLTIGDSLKKIIQAFEEIEAGSGAKLDKFIAEAQDHYRIAIDKIVLRPGLSPLELVTSETITRVDRFFRTISQRVRRDFKNPKLIATLEFPVLFLGAKPNQTPSFYSFMNFADFGLGTWHPKGGMYEIVLAMENLAHSLGVKMHTNSPVDKIIVQDKKAIGISVKGKDILSDVVLSGADYHHSETLLDPSFRQYSEAYWDKKTFAPSSLLFYVGFNQRIPNVEHHNLFFDSDFTKHAEEIYDNAVWPSDPLFYANFPSISDPSMAPENCETGFFLIPIAPDLEDNESLREHYFNKIMNRFELKIGTNVRENIIFKESFCVKDFKETYNSYKGNAYGLANTLMQTAFLRPKLKSSMVQNLYFTGQLTVPGPGVPPALISGKIVADLISKK